MGRLNTAPESCCEDALLQYFGENHINALRASCVKLKSRVPLSCGFLVTSWDLQVQYYFHPWAGKTIDVSGHRSGDPPPAQPQTQGQHAGLGSGLRQDSGVQPAKLASGWPSERRLRRMRRMTGSLKLSGEPLLAI